MSVLLAACGGGDDSTSGAAGSAGPDEPSGSITHLTHVDPATFEPYVAAFKEKYPEVTDVKIERLTNYATEVKTRMSTDDYGDVLGIPASVTPDQLPDFFAPLGERDELTQTYQWLNKSYEGKVYGIPDLGNAQGFLYNKVVWEQAGITDYPTTPDEFLDDLQAIKDSQPDVVPFVTNYKDGWLMAQWENYRGIPSHDPDVVYDTANSDAPWSGGGDYEVIDGLLYDIVARELIEPDPTTATYDETKIKIGSGEIATMAVGSWAVHRAGRDIEKAGLNPDDIGYMPFPVQHDGTFYAVTGPDITLGINVHSENEVTARAWLDFLVDESGYSQDQGGLSPRIDGPVPDVLADFTSQVELFALNPLPPGEESLFSDISTASGIVTNDGKYRQQIVDDARSGNRDKQEIFDDLNAAWADGRAQAGG
ncbi:ABC transporter substrate-binding protein [Jiangella endophytica]|uniref:ABC transporter substrate-binding protein n=1 Tax=Jiangella endophytica TaxID=1623398 RepID=UPI001300B278|nr:extracellular solute-binding protein [Jiangella endophytica]